MIMVTLIKGEWSCYRGGQFKGGRLVMLHFNGRENCDVFNGGSIVMVQRRPVKCRENGHVTEVVSFMEGEWSCYSWSV